mgnify:CR=1 FL=1
MVTPVEPSTLPFFIIFSIAARTLRAAAGYINSGVSLYITKVKDDFDLISVSGTVMAKFITEYGTGFVDSFLTSSLAADVSENAKKEMVEKTVMDMVVMHLVLGRSPST